MKRLTFLFLVVAASVVPAVAQQGVPYTVGVVSESGDIVTWLRPAPADRLVTDRVVPIGIMPTDIDGPHNIAVSPDGVHYYVTVAHGAPRGSLWKLDAATDELLGRTELEMFPTTIALTPDGQFAFVANSDFHGDRPRENVVSVVHTPTMTKITDVPACDMPHGVKANRAGTRVYVSCMHSDEILELDVATLRILRRRRTDSDGGHAATREAHTAHRKSPVSPSGDQTSPGARQAPRGGDQASGRVQPSAGADHASHAAACAPTFVSVSSDDRRLYVACNTANTLQVWDASTLTRTAEIPVGKGAYNVEPSPDGALVLVTNKKDQSVSLVDAVALKEVARVPTSKKVVHGIAYSPDGRLAYISCESIGADPGAVDVIDLAARRVVASVPVPGQPAGIAVRSLTTGAAASTSTSTQH